VAFFGGLLAYSSVKGGQALSCSLVVDVCAVCLASEIARYQTVDRVAYLRPAHIVCIHPTPIRIFSPATPTLSRPTL
jgi:hypothetical protein